MILTPIPLLLILHTAPAPSAPAPEEIVRGRYVEARTASVFAGACHYGAEATTSGREAVLAWSFTSGSDGGVDLAGTGVVAVVAGEANLVDRGAARRSILCFSDRATPSQRRAAGDFVRRHAGSVLGEIVEERTVALSTGFDGDHYRIAAGSLVELDGALLPDRACCKMPYKVWYKPFVALESAVVGCNAVFRCSDASLAAVFERHDDNASFAGSFAVR